MNYISNKFIPKIFGIVFAQKVIKHQQQQIVEN